MLVDKTITECSSLFALSLSQRMQTSRLPGNPVPFALSLSKRKSQCDRSR